LANVTEGMPRKVASSIRREDGNDDNDITHTVDGKRYTVDPSKRLGRLLQGVDGRRANREMAQSHCCGTRRLDGGE